MMKAASLALVVSMVMGLSVAQAGTGSHHGSPGANPHSPGAPHTPPPGRTPPSNPHGGKKHG